MYEPIPQTKFEAQVERTSIIGSLNKAASQLECRHDPDTYHLMVGETSENPSKGEPKSVICGGCGKVWHISR